MSSKLTKDQRHVPSSRKQHRLDRSLRALRPPYKGWVLAMLWALPLRVALRPLRALARDPSNPSCRDQAMTAPKIRHSLKSQILPQEAKKKLRRGNQDHPARTGRTARGFQGAIDRSVRALLQAIRLFATPAPEFRAIAHDRAW